MTRELAGVGSAAALLTTIICWPVIRSPQILIFGNEIVGRHADPSVVMQQVSTGQVSNQYWQPVPDVPGALFAQGVGPIAAYNVLILLTSSSTVLAAYTLGRALNLGKAGAAIAGFGFAFAPAHVEQAGYHPLMLTPDEHLLSFRSVEPATSPDAEVHNGDARVITLRFGYWQWHVLAS